MGYSTVTQDSSFEVEFHAIGQEFSDHTGAEITSIEVESITIGSLYMSHSDAMKMDHKTLVDLLFCTAYDASYERDFE